MGENETLHFTQVASGAAWNLAGTILTKIVSFIYVIYIARVISQNDVGVFYLALGIISVLTVWKDLGLPTALVRYIPYYEEKREYSKAFLLFKNTLIITSIFGGFLTVAIWLLADWIAGIYQNAQLAEAIRILCAFVFVDNIGRTLQSYVVGKADMKTSQMVGNAQAFAKLVITVVLVQILGAGVAAISLGYVLSFLLTYPLFIPSIIKKLSGKEYRQKQEVGYWQMLKEVAPFGFMLIILNTFNVLMSSTDKALLGYLIEPDKASSVVAVYSMAALLAYNINVIPGAIQVIFLPVISRLVAKMDFEPVRKQIAAAQRWMVIATLPFAAVMLVYSSEMLSLFFGSIYKGGGAAMSIFIAAVLLYVFASSISLALAGMRLVNLELKAAVAAASANVVLNVLLIPFFEMEGAALATLASLGIWAAMISKYGKEKIGFETPKITYKVAALGVTLLAVAYFLKPVFYFAQPLFVFSGEIGPYFTKIAHLGLFGAISLVCALILFVLSLAFKCFEKEDILVAKHIMKRIGMPSYLAHKIEKIIQIGVEKK